MGPTLLENLPLHRFSEFFALSGSEIDQLHAAAEPPIRFGRHAIIRREGESPRHVYLLSEGWVASSMLLAAGERQIVKLHLPGDLLGAASLCLTSAADTLFCLSPTLVSRVPAAAFGELMMGSPRFAARMFLSSQRERIALMDRLASMGRSPAIARVAAMLLDLADRLAAGGHGAQDGFDLRMTQEEIGDYLGLTAVHVNRVFRQLQAAGLIVRRRQRVRIVNLDGLRLRAGQSPRIFARKHEWLLRDD